jgi:hypothetical protein
VIGEALRLLQAHVYRRPAGLLEGVTATDVRRHICR